MSEEYDLTPVPVEDHPNILFTAESNKNIGDRINNIEENLISFFKGGLYKVAKDNDIKTPDWMQSAHDYINNPDLNTAIGVASPVGKVPKAMQTSKMKYSEEQINKFKDLHSKDMTYAQIADEMGGDMTRNSVAGLANRLGLKRGESPNPEGRGVADVGYEHTWSTREMAAARSWDKTSALPDELVRRGVDQTMQKLDELSYREDKRFGTDTYRWSDKNPKNRPSNARWMKEEDQILKDHYANNPDATEGPKGFQYRTDEAIKRRSVALGLIKPERSPALWSKEEKNLLTNWYRDPDADLFDVPKGLQHRSESSIGAKARQMGLDKEEIE